jgi:hypothetical protein
MDEESIGNAFQKKAKGVGVDRGHFGSLC